METKEIKSYRKATVSAIFRAGQNGCSTATFKIGWEKSQEQQAAESCSGQAFRHPYW
jgi:hypothetical protein